MRGVYLCNRGVKNNVSALRPLNPQQTLNRNPRSLNISPKGLRLSMQISQPSTLNSKLNQKIHNFLGLKANSEHPPALNRKLFPPDLRLKA